jgi:hypothetical protein
VGGSEAFNNGITRCRGVWLFAFTLFWFLGGACIRAAQPADAPPDETDPVPAESAPHWRKPPPHSRWEITFQSEKKAANAPPAREPKHRPRKVTVTRHGRELLEEIDMEDGKRWETWSLNTVQFQSIAGDDTVWLRTHQPKSNGLPDPTDYQSFREFHWIRKEHYRGIFHVHGIPAAVYLFPLKESGTETHKKLRESQKGPLGGLPLCTGILAAAIHPDTRYPLMLQHDGEIRVYSISTLPSAALTLPRKLTRFRELLAAPARVSPRPLP